MKTTRVSAPAFFTLSALLAAGLASQVHAGLGSFAPADGYDINVFSGSANWSDVSYYNAGSYGANSGGGSGPTPITPNSGKWKVVSAAGGFFPTAATRATGTAGSPPYPTTVPSGTQPTYLIGDHFGGRTDNSALAFRNEVTANTSGPAVYDYAMDIYDTGGTIPSTVTSGPVHYGIYFLTNPPTPGNPGTRARDRFTQSVLDASGNIGAQWGYAEDNEITWRASASGPWNYTGLYSSSTWDHMSIDIDLTLDTFKLTYFNGSTSTTSTLAPSGTPLGVPMTNFTGLRWRLEDGTTGGIGGKNFFDDANFSIPAPGSIGLLGMGGLLVARRRRSN